MLGGRHGFVLEVVGDAGTAGITEVHMVGEDCLDFGEPRHGEDAVFLKTDDWARGTKRGIGRIGIDAGIPAEWIEIAAGIVERQRRHCSLPLLPHFN